MGSAAPPMRRLEGDRAEDVGLGRPGLGVCREGWGVLQGNHAVAPGAGGAESPEARLPGEAKLPSALSDLHCWKNAFADLSSDCLFLTHPM